MYVEEVEVEVVWMDEVSSGYPDLPTTTHFTVYLE